MRDSLRFASCILLLQKYKITMELNDFVAIWLRRDQFVNFVHLKPARRDARLKNLSTLLGNLLHLLRLLQDVV